MQETNNTKIRKVDNSYRDKFLEISQQKKTYCLLNKYKYTYLNSDKTIENTEETLIYQFANELHIEYELLDTESANLVFQIVLLSANKLNCINNNVFSSLYHIFRPSSDAEWSEVIKFDEEWSELIRSMDHEGNIKNVYKSLNSKETLLENAEILIRREVLNLRISENKKLKELCDSLYESNNYKGQRICEIIIDTFILSFEEQNSITAEFNRKIKNHKELEFTSKIENQCSMYQFVTEKMQKHVQAVKNGVRVHHHENPASSYYFRTSFLSIKDQQSKNTFDPTIGFRESMDEFMKKESIKLQLLLKEFGINR